VSARGGRLRPVQRVLLALAWCWAAALPVAAALVPAYDSTSVTSSGTATSGNDPTTVTAAVTVTHTTATLLDENGWTVILVTAVPLLVASAVTVALLRRDRRRSGAGPLAWVLTGLLAAGNLAALLSIGVFVLPVTAGLVMACALHGTGSSGSGARRGPEPAMLGR
jgi:hypothetical protein